MAQKKPQNKKIEAAKTQFFIVSGSTKTLVNPDLVPSGTELLMTIPSGMTFDVIAGLISTGSVGVNATQLQRYAKWDPATGSFPNFKEPRGG